MNPFSPWDGNNAPAEVPKVQERTAGPWRMVWAVSAVTAWSGKGELTVLGSEGPLNFLFYFCCYYVLILLVNTVKMIYILCIK